MGTMRVVNSGGERRCKRVEEISEEHAKLWARGIGRRWIGGGEFGSMSEAVPTVRKREEREPPAVLCL
jgi:hypothetical protein